MTFYNFDVFESLESLLEKNVTSNEGHFSERVMIKCCHGFLTYNVKQMN